MTAGELQALCLERVGEDPQSPVYYTEGEALVALNVAQRLFVLLTLCLERTVSLTVPGATSVYALTPTLYDLILLLRVRTSVQKLRAARLSDLAAADASWTVSPGEPRMYAAVGKLLALYPQRVGAVSVSVTYAHAPALLSGSGSVPEIPAEYHACLVDGAIPLMRTKEGAQEWQKTLPLWNRFLDEAQRMGEYVRARNREQGYDNVPFELAKFDRSRMVVV